MRNAKALGRGQSGFSLIEILLVLGIIVFLATMVGIDVVRRYEDAKVSEAKAGVSAVAAKVNNYYLDIGKLPVNIDALVQKPSGVDNWKGPYLSKAQRVDPWKNAYVLHVPGQDGFEFSVISYGADGQVGGSERARDIAHTD